MGQNFHNINTKGHMIAILYATGSLVLVRMPASLDWLWDLYPVYSQIPLHKLCLLMLAALADWVRDQWLPFCWDTMVVDVGRRGVVGFFFSLKPFRCHDSFAMALAPCFLDNGNLECVVTAWMGKTEWMYFPLGKRRDFLKGSILLSHPIWVIGSVAGEAEQWNLMATSVSKASSLFMKPTSTPLECLRSEVS